ncbi:16S rRNA (cytidine(1402)-2'-O)-methyltransferase [Alteribacter natronophilus]|uniref:16S rRNA (cytidine(1402)-2'-O)-methyltransferase n=1 Tax=Alteribacter natronophilus TaxID=2583810 RepID=UPI00110E43B3|nr:16S rRNA (cytidine(1402)-2'-O)-methyltransferase [Alteribacter natronophilus]TMW69970.1 16S rRNA (cytidine(1402)-2'-O)-methyltransferase [Alteribacter natronophilus]
MNIQKSFKGENQEKGTLYLVPTPIGNLEDMTYRAVRVLKEADVIAAEDTRNTRKLCHVFEIDTPLISYHEHSRQEKEEEITGRLHKGESVALVSDAGMPAVSDPGQDLVKRCISEQLTVVPLPGANAALSGLVASGLSTDMFTFVGFLNRKKKVKRETLESWKKSRETLMFYESPHRISDTLEEMANIFGGSRQAVLCRELTKKHEEFLRGTLEELHGYCVSHSLKGEMVILVDGQSGEQVDGEEEEQWWAGLDAADHVKVYIDKGMTSKDAIKKAAKDRNENKREVYKAFHT